MLPFRIFPNADCSFLLTYTCVVIALLNVAMTADGLFLLKFTCMIIALLIVAIVISGR